MGVKINNSIKSLNTKLKNGDQVEIITGKSPSFSSEWLDLSITGKAKACIKRYISIKEEEDFKKLGKEILINHFKNEKIRYSETNINNVLTIKTVQIAPFRILMTALKDILLDTNIVFTKEGIKYLPVI